MSTNEVKVDDLTLYYKEVYDLIDKKTTSDDYGSYILSRVKGGKKKVFNKTLTEIRDFDLSFLDVIESVYPALVKIMKEPKRTIRYEEEIVAVEKARKVNSTTVKHLSSHTHLIKEITEQGDVIPSKVLTTFTEDELGIYENRFIKSLVKRIEMFLDRRFDLMKVSLDSFITNKLNVENSFLASGQQIKVTIDVEVKDDLNQDKEKTKEQFERLSEIRRMIKGLKNTEFMRALAKAKDVLPPIMKTNIIMLNPDFRMCFNLWLYLDKIDGIQTNIESSEKSYRYSDLLNEDMNTVMTLALTAFIKNREIEGIYNSKNLPIMKAPKVENNQEIELDPTLEADHNKLEDYKMNELLLSETAKYFEGSFKGLMRSGVPYSESIRVLYRQMLEMLDQIYHRVFNVADEELEAKDLHEQIEYARRRMQVLQAVRTQKQANVMGMAREEKKIERIITNLDRKIEIQTAKERAKEEKRKAREEALRLQAIAKAKAQEEKRRRLEKEAIARQKEAEKKRLEKEKAKAKEDAKKARQRERAKQLAAKKREHMKTSKRRNIRPRKKVNVTNEQ
jgi:hypothetical protein